MKMFIDRKDILRRDYNVRDNEIEKSLKKHDQLGLPMPAFGEVICKVRDKCGDNVHVVLKEMNRLMDDGIIVPCYLKNASATFNIAKELANIVEDDRDQISPMDALIAASATTDPCCTILYTTDIQLITDSRVSDIINDWRDERDYKPLAIRDISNILRAR